MKRDGRISLLRVIGMLCIILCHFFSWIGISSLSQLFNVGIFVFLMISGYLYSARDIKKHRNWLIKRWKYLYIPVYLWLFVVVIFLLVKLQRLPGLKEFLLVLFNLQGIPWILTFLPKIGQMGGILGCLGHLWFLTVIYICYMLLLLVKRYEVYFNKHYRILAIVAIVCFVILALFNINIIYFICFFIGYAVGKTKIVYSKKTMIYGTIVMILAIGIRLITRRVLDGMVVYDTIIVGGSHTILAGSMFILVSYLYASSRSVRSFAESIAVRIIDEYSYFIYITHYLFLSSSFGLKTLNTGMVMKTAIFVIASIITAVLLKMATDFLENKVVAESRK